MHRRTFFLFIITPLFSLIIFFALGFSKISQTSAFTFTPTADPQYVVMNFSTINELNWAAPEPEWQTKIKPQILEQINELRAALPLGNAQRKLAWSTLMEYMNFPLDTASDTSPYAIKMRRIMEITDAENIPVFVPLNGFQWWDQLPELYNWWDPDGTHTDSKFFARQKNPAEFKQRFIKGYNPENKWNVEWQDWQTPMQLNYRNWGGGGFRLAPPPDLSNQHRAPLTYRNVQRARITIIIKQMLPFLEKWQKEGRSDLFAGVTIGTEVSLNASVKPIDEFMPYGYRDVQDVLCGAGEPTCGASSKFTSEQIDAARIQSVHTYLLDLTHLITDLGIPKQRVYTHVWGEAKKGEPRYVDYAAAAATPYARPGISLYGYATDPLSLPVWAAALKENGEESWGAPEYSAGTSQTDWQKGLANVFDNGVVGAHAMAIYNWSEHKGTGAIPALASFLKRTPVVVNKCSLPEVLPKNENGEQDPGVLSWGSLASAQQLPANAAFTLYIKKGGEVENTTPDVFTQKIEATTTSFPVPKLSPGVYSWSLEMDGCNVYIQRSEPRRFVITAPLAPSIIPGWLQKIYDFIGSKVKLV